MSTSNGVRVFAHVARFVLENSSALSISTGSPDGVFDTALVRDANGLPAIPGSSLAGVLRHLIRDSIGNDTAEALFGTEALFEQHGEGRASRVQVAWGVILDSKGHPVEGLVLGEAATKLTRDPILGPLLAQQDAPLTRHRVRIGHRGAAADTGKFDRAVLPAGYRFACELFLLDFIAEPDDWCSLLETLGDPRLRLGGASRAGLGRMGLKSLATGCFDLSDPDAARSFRNLERGIGVTAGLQPCETSSSRDEPPQGWIRLDIELEARDFWRVGQGNESILARDDVKGNPKESNALPVLEPRVTWADDNHAEVALRLPIAPGSAIKGALAHRAEFYANCMGGEDPPRWADDQTQDGDDGEGGSVPRPHSARLPRHPAMVALFGDTKEKTTKGKPTGQAGRIYIEDARIDFGPDQVGMLMHNAIDRFTGGVRDRLLFGEDLLWRTRLPLSLLVDVRTPVEEGDQRLLDRGLAALHLALRDLCDGSLAIGAGSGRGHGYFTATQAPDLDRLSRGCTP